MNDLGRSQPTGLHGQFCGARREAQFENGLNHVLLTAAIFFSTFLAPLNSCSLSFETYKKLRCCCCCCCLVQPLLLRPLRETFVRQKICRFPRREIHLLPFFSSCSTFVFLRSFSNWTLDSGKKDLRAFSRQEYLNYVLFLFGRRQNPSEMRQPVGKEASAVQ